MALIRKYFHLVLALLFGLCASILVISNIHFTIPGTNVLTDPRELFVTIGAALTGPIGGIIVGILSSIYDPTPDLRIYVILQHIVGAVFIGYSYKWLLKKNLQLPRFIIGWILILFSYYFVLYIPVYFFVYYLFPDLYYILSSNNSDPVVSLIQIYVGWLPEVFFTSIITSLIMIALPDRYKITLWGETVNLRQVKPVKIYKAKFFNKLLSGNFLGIRLAIWYLILSLVPFFIIKVFIQNNVMTSMLELESERLLIQTEVFSSNINSTFETDSIHFPQIHYGIYEFVLPGVSNEQAMDTDYLNSITDNIIEKVLPSLYEKDTGVLIDTKELLCVAYSKVDKSNLVFIAFANDAKIRNLLSELESQSNVVLGISLMLIAIFSAVAIWLLVAKPIKSLIDASRKVRDGDYNASIDLDKMDDELADLSEVFNQMTQNISSAYKSLQNEMEERVRIEKEKYEFEKELYYITNNILDVIIQTDKEGKIIYATPSIERTFGFSIEYMRHKNILQFIQSDDLDNFKESFNKLVKSYEPCKLQYRQKNAEGSYLNVETIGNPILDDNLKISTVIFTVRDITDRIEYQESLRKAKDSAEKSDKVKTEFLAQMSHEIRTPVNTILNFAYLLQEEIEDKLSDDLKDGFSIIERGSRRLIRTIDSILNLSQLQFGTLEVHKTQIDLVEIIDQVVVEFKKLAESKNISINVNLESEECVLYIDHYTVTQLVANLVDNAIKYSTGGTITISISKEENKVKLIIADTGIGMSEEFVNKLFEPFTQEETGYTRRFEGTGLGLALVKKYCEINKATIEVNSKKGVGTSFIICFKDKGKKTKTS